MFLINIHGLKRPIKEGVCPYLEDGLCGAREGRALGCRIFFCEGDRAIQEQLYEKYLGKIQELFSMPGNELYYGELLQTLKEARV